MTTAARNSLSDEEEGVSLSSSALKIGKLSSIYLAGQLLPRVLGIVLLPIFTHYLVPAQMGIVTITLQTAAVMGVLVQLGLWNAQRRLFFSTEESARRPLVRTILLGQTAQGAVICVLLSVAGIWTAEILLPNLPLSPAYVYALWLIIVWECFFGAWVQLAVCLTQLLERAGVCAGITSLRYLLQAGLGVAAVVGLGWQGFGRRSTMAMAIAILGIAAFSIVWRYGQGAFQPSLFKQAFRTGLTFAPNNLFRFLAIGLNMWLVNRMASPAALGTYSVAVMLPQVMQMPLASLVQAAYPTLARLMGDGGASARKRQSRLYTLLIVGNLSLALPVMLFGPVAIKILTAPAYHQAAQVVPILTGAWLLLGLSMVASQTVFFVGGGLWLSTAAIASIIVNVTLSLVLIPEYGIYGAAWAMVGGYVTRLAVCTSVGCYLYPLPWEATKILRALACAGALVAVDICLLPEMALGWAVVSKAALLLAMFPMLWVVGVVSTAEVRRLKEAVSRKLGTLATKTGN